MSITILTLFRKLIIVQWHLISRWNTIISADLDRSLVFLQHIIFTIYVHTSGQMITQPPVSITAALGTNATFTCHGNAQVFWNISGTQITLPDQLPIFARASIYTSVPTSRFSELIVTATAENNFTRTIQCLVALGAIDAPVESEIVRLFVYGE